MSATPGAPGRDGAPFTLTAKTAERAPGRWRDERGGELADGLQVRRRTSSLVQSWIL